MTKKIYYENPYNVEGIGNVIDCFEKDGKNIVVLDRTPFCPEGGGQPSDTGYIDNLKVEYVYEKNDKIYHVIDSFVEKGKSVKCVVDFDRRFDNMQQHSGEHLLSAAIFKLYKGVNCGFHMGEDYITIDIDIKDMTEAMISTIEETVNDYIYKNVDVITYFTTKEEAGKLPLRKAIKAEGKIRVVQMGMLDYSTCCGTHVLKTAEVGIVKILKAEKNKGMTRIYFKCGKRALDDYIKKHNQITFLSNMFSTEDSKVIQKVKSLTDEIYTLKKQLEEYKKNDAKIEAVNLVKEAENNGVKVISQKFDLKTFDEIQFLYDEIKNEPFVFIFCSLSEKKILFAHNGDFNIECGKIFKENLKRYNGKGGGNAKRSQATFQNNEELNLFYDFLKKTINI